MACIEGYGAACPCCGEPVMYKKESGMGWLEFDACPSCGFLDYTVADVRTDEDQTDEKRKDLWLMLLERHKCRTLPELKSVVEKWGVERDDGTVFNYSGYTPEQLQAKQVPDVELPEGFDLEPVPQVNSTSQAPF
ncbi:hypothetical protein [Vibrio crassostreae]|uniref:hypothetical protein n=1 Tax=Vibrio crassostreae TaxID=246167 RepID=UPI001B30D751|nr:hypothetical protein [Vibrio crassostreae]